MGIGEVCQHGQLARQCEICVRDARIDSLESETKLEQEIRRLKINEKASMELIEEKNGRIAELESRVRALELHKVPHDGDRY